jgi:hypothetical protein
VPRFRNVSDDTRSIPELGITVEPDGLFDVPEDRADAFEAQPWFAPAAPAKPTRTKDKE